MPKPTKGPRLGSGPSHERLILRTLAEQLFEHGKITTTEAKAKRLRPLAEKLITFGKKGDLAARRQVAQWRKRPDPGPFDTAKLMPLTLLVIVLLGSMSALLLYADIFKPVRIFG